MIDVAIALSHLARDERVQGAASRFAGRIAGTAVTGAWRRWRARRRKQPERIVEGESGPFRWRREACTVGRGLVFVGRGEESRAPTP